MKLQDTGNKNNSFKAVVQSAVDRYKDNEHKIN